MLNYNGASSLTVKIEVYLVIYSPNWKMLKV